VTVVLLTPCSPTTTGRRDSTQVPVVLHRADCCGFLGEHARSVGTRARTFCMPCCSFVVACCPSILFEIIGVTSLDVCSRLPKIFGLLAWITVQKALALPDCDYERLVFGSAPCASPL